jgi:hypothetical protein
VAVVWIAWVSTGVLGIAAVRELGDLGCEHETSDSNYGELSWSALPFGPVCTWTIEVNDVDDRDGPSILGSIWVLGVLAGPAVYVLLGRPLRQQQSDQATLTGP